MNENPKVGKLRRVKQVITPNHLDNQYPPLHKLKKAKVEKYQTVEQQIKTRVEEQQKLKELKKRRNEREEEENPYDNNSN